MSVTVRCGVNAVEISTGQKAVINAARQKMTSDITVFPATENETIKVMYNGNNIALLDGTKTATLKCKGKVMKGSVVVSIVSNDTDDTIIASQTIAYIAEQEGWASTLTQQTFKLDNNVTVKIAGTNSGRTNSSGQMYLFASPQGTMTVTVPEGYELVSVTISTETNKTYAFLYVDGGSEDISNVKTAVSGSSVVLKPSPNGNSGTGKRVQIIAIEVEYKKT